MRLPWDRRPPLSYVTSSWYPDYHQRRVPLGQCATMHAGTVSRLEDRSRSRLDEGCRALIGSPRATRRSVPDGGSVAMFELKFLSQEGIPGALAKAERYRLLNQAWEAECIYRDVLQVDADNQEAVIGLVLALTDQFE